MVTKPFDLTRTTLAVLSIVGLIAVSFLVVRPLSGGDSVGGHVGGCHMALHATVAVGFWRSSLGRRYADDVASAVPRAASAFDGRQFDRYSRQPPC